MACSKSGAIIYTSSPDVFNLCHTFQTFRSGSHPNSAGFASFDPAVDDSSDAEACQANNVFAPLSFVNTMKLMDISKFRKKLKIGLTTTEQVAQTRLLLTPY